MTYNLTTVLKTHQIALSNEAAPLLTGTSVIALRLPQAMILTDVRLSCNVAPTGAAIQVDVLYNGSTIFSTKPTIAIGATTSVGGTPCVITTPSIPTDGLLTFSILQVGSTISGSGLKVMLLGN